MRNLFGMGGLHRLGHPGQPDNAAKAKDCRVIGHSGARLTAWRLGIDRCPLSPARNRRPNGRYLDSTCHDLPTAAQRLAHERPGQTLQATALVHEAYVRLVGSGEPPRWERCGHFFAAPQAMRRILIDRARLKQTRKAGGGRRRLKLDDLEPALEQENGDRLLALNEALRQLEAEDPHKADWSSSGSSPASPPTRRPPRWTSPPPPPRRTVRTPGAGSGW